MSHLERRRQLWYALLTIPADLREHFGKIRFVQSLGTADKREAEIIAGPVIASWRGQIRQAKGQSNPLQQEALRWKQELRSKAGDPMQLTIAEEFLVDRAGEIESTKGASVADEFHGLATGSRTPSNILIEEWKAQVDLTQKTKDQMFKDVDLMVSKFGSLQEITKGNVKRWMDEIAKTGKGPASQKRIISFCRNYWNYLQSHEAVPADADPFFKVLNITKAKKASTGGSWVPFQPEEVVKLWNAANEKKDDTLADLIKLGAYTGARIEELCSLKLTEVTSKAFRITDSKTEAGIREVPIHSALLPLVNKMKDASTDDYLISGLTFNKYDDRSNAIGKRFGRLKDVEGFGSQHVFHSIRKTLTTLLENAGISENLAADIVGHEKPRITYGLYSGGATLELKREALEKVKYPFKK